MYHRKLNSLKCTQSSATKILFETDALFRKHVNPDAVKGIIFLCQSFSIKLQPEQMEWRFQSDGISKATG